jgi:hypothetical protein
MTVSDTCVHHWKLESPAGSWAPAVCKLCGMESKFKNSLEDVDNFGIRRLRKKRKTNEDSTL